MRRPETIEKLYLDFDGFFASVMQQAIPKLRGKPVGVIPFETSAAHSTVVIACSKEAKAAGCKNIMRVPDALKVCPNLVLVPQRPDLFRRAHNALLNEITCEIPIETVKSIDEISAHLDKSAIASPEQLAHRIKDRLHRNIGEYITCSIGFAANRLLAKVACKVDKPNGVTIWHPEDMPEPLFSLPLDDIPGVGKQMLYRLLKAGITTTKDFWHTQPKQLRALWRSVSGERMWYAVHGYDIHAVPTKRGMYGHARVLPPGLRGFEKAQSCSKMLLTKAARRMRRDGYCAGSLLLWLSSRESSWSKHEPLPNVQDDHACLDSLSVLWQQAKTEICVRPNVEIIRVGVTLGNLSIVSQRQLDFLYSDDGERKKSERLTNVIDSLNHKFGKRVINFGPWSSQPGSYAGGKIAFNRIPSAEDFW